MDNTIKSGKDVINDFFAEIYNISNTDKKTLDAIVELHFQGKLSEKNIQNALDQILIKQQKIIDKEND